MSEYDPQHEINDCKRRVLRAALNIARLERLGFHIDDDGRRVMGDVQNQTEIQQYKLREASSGWLNVLTETQDDALPA